LLRLIKARKQKREKASKVSKFWADPKLLAKPTERPGSGQCDPTK